MEKHYQKQNYPKNYESNNRDYQKQDLRDLYSMVNMFDQLIAKAVERTREKNAISDEYLCSASNK